MTNWLNENRPYWKRYVAVIVLVYRTGLRGASWGVGVGTIDPGYAPVWIER